MYDRDKIIQTLKDIVKESEKIEPYVVIAQPKRNKEDISIQTFESYGICHINLMGFSYGYVDIAGEKVDVARNYLISQVIETKAKYMLFIGDDTALPWDAFINLHKTAEENPNSIIVGVYYVKAGSPMIDIKDDIYIKVANVDPGQLIEVWQAGMDCMLIPTYILREMFEKEPDIPFCCVANGIEDIPFVGEDNFFYYRARKFGYKILCDTNIQCLHVDMDTGKYTAHPSVNLDHYFTNVEIKEPLTMTDKMRLEKRWHDRLPNKEVNR